MAIYMMVLIVLHAHQVAHHAKTEFVRQVAVQPIAYTVHYLHKYAQCANQAITYPTMLVQHAQVVA